MAVKRPTQSEKLNSWLLNKKKTLHICALYQIASSEKFEWSFNGSFIVIQQLAETCREATAPPNPTVLATSSNVRVSSHLAHSAVNEKAASKAVMWLMRSRHGIISSLWLMQQLVPHGRVCGPWQSLACCLGYLYKCCD